MDLRSVAGAHSREALDDDAVIEESAGTSITGDTGTTGTVNTDASHLRAFYANTVEIEAT